MEVPEGWFENTIESAASAPVSYGVVQTGDYEEDGIPCVRVVDLVQGDLDPLLMIMTSNEISQSYRRTILSHRDIMIALRGVIGKAALVPERLAGCNLTRGIARFSSDRHRFCPEFLVQLLNYPAWNYQLARRAGGSALQEISIAALRGFKFAAPPIEEQRRIAEILGTWDRAIETTEKLIAASEAQKKSLMQQLLTGQKRLPGFKGKWRKVRLEDLGKIMVSNVDKKSVHGETAVRLCNYMDVYSRDQIEADQEFMQSTASAAQIKRFSLKCGDVIITKDSERPDDIAIPSVVSSTAPDLVCGYHLAIIRSGENSYGPFLKYLFEEPRTQYYFATRANGATRFGLTLDAIENAPMRVPKTDEQQAIADVLASAEFEGKVLNEKLQHFKNEKAALMQQLLTGKRRVKMKEMAA